MIKDKHKWSEFRSRWMSMKQTISITKSIFYKLCWKHIGSFTHQPSKLLVWFYLVAKDTDMRNSSITQQVNISFLPLLLDNSPKEIKGLLKMHLLSRENKINIPSRLRIHHWVIDHPKPNLHFWLLLPSQLLYQAKGHFINPRH